MAELSTILASGDIEEIQLTTTGYLLQHDSGDVDAGKFGISCGVYEDLNLPDTRANVVWGIGYNIANNGNGREDITDVALNIVFENYYVQDSIPASEFHLDFTDTGGTSHRFLSTFLPRDGGDGSILSLRSDILNVMDYDDVQRIKIDFTNNNIDFPGAALTTRYRVNNVVTHQQSNAADSAYLSHAYFDGDDRWRLGNNFIFVGAAPTAGAYANVFGVLNATSIPANGQVLRLEAAAVAGSAMAVRADGQPTGDWTFGLNNNSNTSTANAILELRTIGAGAGDPKIYLNVNGATRWQFGLDNSESDRLAWNTNALGSSDRMTLDTSGNLGVAGHVKPDTDTVATLPSASTAGAGAIKYCSDGDAGAACLVVSDGTNWKVVALGATASAT